MDTIPPPHRYFRCLGQFPEAADILREIEAQPDLFDVDPSRQLRIAVQRETRSIPLRSKRRHADLPDQKDRDVLGSDWSTCVDRLPALRRFLEVVAEREASLLGRVRVVNLPAGQRVYPHVDRGNYYRQHERHHLVLRSERGSWLASGGEAVRMRVGELWWFDNLQLHEAFNDGDEDRIHVIFDLLPRQRAHLLEKPAVPAETRRAGGSPGFPAGVHALVLPGGLPCRLIVPSALRDAVPLVSVHGLMRDQDALVAALAERAEAQGRLVILPLFSQRDFPHYRLGRCPQQADAALLRTLRELALRTGVDTVRIDLAGFSAGAQFAHRFAMLYPNRIRRLVLGAAGWYTLPDGDREHRYPLGLGGNDLAARVMHANLRSFLALPITVAVGACDDACDANTRREVDLDALQGTDRVERARRYAAALEREARAHGIRPSVTFRTMPASGHDFGDCARAGLAELMLLTVDEPRVSARVVAGVSLGEAA